METQVEAAFLLEVGSKMIEKLMSEKDELQKKAETLQETAVTMTRTAAQLEGKLHAIEKEKETMALLLDQLQEETKARQAALHISGRKIVELHEQNTKLTNALTAALTLLDYMLGELRNAGVVPSAAMMLAKKRFDQQMQELMPGLRRMADPIPSPSELKPGELKP